MSKKNKCFSFPLLSNIGPLPCNHLPMMREKRCSKIGSTRICRHLSASYLLEMRQNIGEMILGPPTAFFRHED